MASAVASKGAPQAVLSKLFAEPSGEPSGAYFARHPVYSIAAARRLFNSGDSLLGRYKEEEDDVSSGSEDDVAVNNRYRARDISGPMSFTSSDLVDSSGTPSTLGGLLSKLESVLKAGSGSLAASRRGSCVAKQDDDAVTVKVPMPGLGKEHVKVWAEKNTLVIKGEGDKKLADGDNDGNEVHYSRRIELPADAFKMDQIRAEMKNGLLKVTVPRVKHEERKDVFHVTVE